MECIRLLNEIISNVITYAKSKLRVKQVKPVRCVAMCSRVAPIAVFVSATLEILGVRSHVRRK